MKPGCPSDIRILREAGFGLPRLNIPENLRLTLQNAVLQKFNSDNKLSSKGLLNYSCSILRGRKGSSKNGAGDMTIVDFSL